MSEAPKVDYNDTSAVIDAAHSLAKELAESHRHHPQWLTDVVARSIATQLTAKSEEGEAYAVVPHDEYFAVASSFVLMGILAERQGWPLVGDMITHTSTLPSRDRKHPRKTRRHQ